MDDNGHLPLSPLLENEDTPPPGLESHALATTNTTSSFAAGDLFFPSNSRRRRLFSRLSRIGDPPPPPPPPIASSSAGASRSLTTFNPEAVEFVPAPKMKRKASSSARFGKSTLSAPRTSLGNPDQPTINSGDLFGSAAGISTLDTSILETILQEDDDSSSDIFELEMQDLRALSQEQSASTRQRERLQDVLAVMRRNSEKIQTTTTSVPPQSRAALLFSYDRQSSSDANDTSARIRYLPLCPASSIGRRESITKDTTLTILANAQQHIDNAALKSTSSKARWPSGDLPVEIFELIIDYLSRDDVKSMRLVTKEFEQKVSRALFNTSVVPFNTELYDMIDEDARVVTRNARSEGKGKGRARDSETIVDSRNRLHWQNAKDDAEGKVYKGHGLRVFQGFGPHIKRFGMSFEVADIQLSKPPIKKELDHVESYYGSYDWPTQQYTRFANLAGLERTADDTLRMKAAFSNLKNVRDLALSLDSGLGWLNGPDKSMRAQIFDRPSKVFGDSREIPDRQMQEAEDFWSALQACHRGVGSNAIPKETTLSYRLLNKPPAELKGLQDSRYADSRRWPAIAANRVIPANGTSPGILEDVRHGVLYTTSGANDLSSPPVFDKSALVPADLRKEQKEWLLETEWAQRAFLECYMLAVIDNPIIFGNVKSLNIAKLSSGFIPLLANEPFWDALPGLADVTIHVKPDWRSVEKDNAGFAETTSQNPSEAVRMFNRFLLRDQICLRPSITTLNIGWAAGGEHAEGMFARNASILPAPICQLEQTTAANTNSGLIFRHVEHLTLTNCWLTPPALAQLIRDHAIMPLKKLTLDSVSLTAHPRFPAAGQQQQIAQALAALQAGGAQPIGVQAPHGIAVQQNQQAQAQANAWPAANAMPMFNNAPGLNGPPAPAVPAVGNMAPHQWLHQMAMNQAAAAAMNGNMGAAQLIPPPVMGFAAGQNNINAMPPNMQAVQQASHWTSGHREGSWPELLDKISPGPIFSDYLPQPQPWEEQLPERPVTNLQTIEFKSCGYAKLNNNTTFDQFAIEAAAEHHFSAWFRTRQVALNPAMMTTSDRYLARIVQHIPQRELNALLFGWGLNEGWADRSKAEEAEFDGMLPGGTGRFSGVIERGMALISEVEARQT